MIILNIFTDLLDTFLEFIDPVVQVVKDTWYDIQSFLLRYMSQDVFNVIAFGVVVAVVLIVVLAVMNHRD